MPRVTVVTATYNWATVLPHAIGSVLDQSYDDFELLVVGDGCTDESADVVAAIDDPRVHWHDLGTNAGHQSGPNTEGLRRARGELIAYLGHDDLWLPNHLASLVPAVDAGARFAHASALMVRPDGPPDRFPADGWAYRPGAWIPPTTVIHDRQLALDVGGWQPPSATSGLDPDAELWGRLAASAPPVHVPRLTAVKLSAAARRGVYRDRPDHEQAYWLARIRAAPDPEADLVGAIGQPYRSAGEAPAERSRLDGERLVWAARTRLRRLRGRPAVTSAERIRLRRRDKGLDA